MAYSLTNTTKKKSSSSSGSSNSGTSITVTRSDREANKKGNSGSVSSGGSSSPSYDKNTDYAALIQDAVRRGESQAVIDGYNAQRDAKIKGEGLNYSSLTDNDIANYRNTNKNYGFNGSYDSTGVLGNMDNGNYGIKNPFEKDYSDFNTNVNFDERIAAAKASGASQDTINGLLQQKEYSEKVRNGEINPYGYGEGMGYGNRNTRFTFEMNDGSFVPVSLNATNWRDAAKLAGINPDDVKNTTTSTYGTASSNYAKPGYGFGTIMGGNDFTTDLRDNDPTGHFYDMNNMNLSFLSGRDGMDYRNPYAGLDYQGNGITNAYDKGTGFAGQGGVMGGYGVEGPNMDDIYANYGNADYGYKGPTAEDIQAKMDEAYAGYQDAVDQRNDALAAAYASQIKELQQQAEEEQRANYINYKLAGLNMPAQMQAAGINGGIAESTLAGLESDYMKNYNNTAGTLTNAVNQLKIAQNNAIAEGNMEAANMYAQMAQNSITLQMQAAQAEQSYNQWVQEMAFARTQWQAEQARYNAELEYNRMLSAQAAQAEETEKLIKYAQTVGDWNLYESLTGTDASYIKQMSQAELNSLLLSNAKKSSSGSSNGYSGKNLTTSQYSDLKDLYNSGNFNAYLSKVDDFDATGYNRNLDNSIDRIAANSDIWYRANRSGSRTPVKKSQWAEGR